MYGILLSTALIFVLITIVVTKKIISGILSSTSPMLSCKFYLSVFYWFIWIKLETSANFFSKLFTFVFIVPNTIFLTTSLLTMSFSFFKSIGTVSNLPTSKYSIFCFYIIQTSRNISEFINVNFNFQNIKIFFSS